MKPIEYDLIRPLDFYNNELSQKKGCLTGYVTGIHVYVTLCQ